MKTKNHRLLQCSLEILEFIAFSVQPVSFKEVTEKIDLPKSTTHHLLQTLIDLNYVNKNEYSGKLSIGLKSFEVGNTYLSSNPFYSMAKELIEATSVKCNETTHFAILNGTDVIYLYKFDSTQPLRVFSHIGKRVPAHATALGKALLSGYSDETIRTLYPGTALPKLTEHTITSTEILLKQLEDVRRTGVAYEKEESSPYIQCIAVPIKNKVGLPVAGISISVPIYKAEKDIEKLKALLFDAKKQLESTLSLFE